MAKSFKSEVAINRPNGILPGANVFQLPPPAVEAKAIPEESAGADWVGATAGADAVEPVDRAGIAEAAATVIGAFVDAGAGGGGVSTVDATGVIAAAGGCCATTGTWVAATEAAGVAVGR